MESNQYNIQTIADLEILTAKYQLPISAVECILQKWQNVIFLNDYTSTADLFNFMHEFMSKYSGREKPIFADIDLDCQSGPG